MRRFKYQSKNKHVTIVLDIYSPYELVAMVRKDIQKISKWRHTPKDKHRKLFEFKIERK